MFFVFEELELPPPVVEPPPPPPVGGAGLGVVWTGSVSVGAGVVSVGVVVDAPVVSGGVPVDVLMPEAWAGPVRTGR